MNAAAQESVRPQLIGRMMSLMTMGSYGMAQFGALLMGWVFNVSSGRVALAVSAVSAVVCLMGVLVRTRVARRQGAGHLSRLASSASPLKAFQAAGSQPGRHMPGSHQ